MQFFARMMLVLFLLIVNSLCIAANNGQLTTLSHFENIKTDGNFQINLVRSNKTQVWVDNAAQDYVEAYVEGNTLILNTIPYKNEANQLVYPPASITIYMPYLVSLDLSQRTIINRSNVPTSSLTITADDNSYVNLTGNVPVTSITVNGNSKVSVRWVNSKELNINGNDCARINVAGTADLFQVRLAGTSQLNAKYLRPKVMLVQTRDQSIAQVLSIQSLYAFATDQSNIYYYKTPGNYLDYNQDLGNSLQLGYWE